MAAAAAAAAVAVAVRRESNGSEAEWRSCADLGALLRMIFLVSARPRSSLAECAAPCLAAVLLRPRAAACADGGPPGPADPWALPCSEGRSGGGGTRLGPGERCDGAQGPGQPGADWREGRVGDGGGRDRRTAGWLRVRGRGERPGSQGTEYGRRGGGGMSSECR